MAVWESELNDADYVNFNTVGIPTYENLQDWFNITQSSGLICGGEFADNTDGSITVAAGCGIVKTTDNILGDTIFFDWPENINVTLTNNAINYAYIDYNGGAPVVSSTDDFSTVDFTTQFIIGLIYREDTTLHILEAGSRRFDFAHRILIQDFEVNGFQRSDGLIVNETGTRNFNISEGSFYYISDKHTLAEFDSSGADTFTYLYRDAGTGWTEVADQSQIDNFYYDDDSGTLAEIGNNRYGVAWLYQEFDGDVHVLYGQGSYKLAEANDAQPPLILPTRLSTFAFVVGKVIIYKSATSFTELHSAFDVVFTPSVIIPHNDTISIQGGTTDEYYHLTSAQHTLLTGNLYRSHNLLDNSKFSVNPQSTLEEYGTQITLTDVTFGVCLTANTQGLKEGDLFTFDSGDFSGTIARVDSVVENVSFTLTDTSLTDSGAPGTGYRMVPGYFGATAFGPDGWIRAASLPLHIIDGGLNFTPQGANKRVSWPLDPSAESHLKRFRGRTVTFAAYATATAASSAAVAILTSAGFTDAEHSGDGAEQWMEVTVDIPIDATEVSFGLWGYISGEAVQFHKPMLVFGDHIGKGNYAPIPQEEIMFDSYVTLLSSETISANTSYDLHLLSKGKLPASMKRINTWLTGTSVNVNDTLYTSPVGTNLHCTVAGVGASNNGTTKVLDGLVSLTRGGTWTNVNLFIQGGRLG
jgi:hypothetical protein